MYQFPAFPPSHYNYIRLATHHHPHTWRRWNGGRNGGYPFLARTLRYGRVLTTQQLTRGKGRRMDERVVPSEFIVQSIRSPLVKDIHTQYILFVLAEEGSFAVLPHPIISIHRTWHLVTRRKKSVERHRTRFFIEFIRNM